MGCPTETCVINLLGGLQSLQSVSDGAQSFPLLGQIDGTHAALIQQLEGAVWAEDLR